MSDVKLNGQNRTHTLETTLVLLKAIEEEGEHSQRSLATRLGVALGLTNSLLKRCIKKGILKVSKAPARRFAYYLTPKGFAEKSKLTAEYLSYSLKFFREARSQYDGIFENCEAHGWKRVAIYGASELTEIATLAAAGTDVSLVAIIDPSHNAFEFCGLPVKSDMAALDSDGGVDAVVMATTENTQETYIHLINQIDRTRILAPDFLFVSSADNKTENEKVIP